MKRLEQIEAEVRDLCDVYSATKAQCAQAVKLHSQLYGWLRELAYEVYTAERPNGDAVLMMRRVTTCLEELYNTLGAVPDEDYDYEE